MKTAYRSLCVAVALALIVLAYVVPSGPVPQTFAARTSSDLRTLVVARDLSDARTLDPDRIFEPSDEVVDGNIYDPLVTFRGEDFIHPYPGLATSWTVSPNNRVFTFYLRHGVRFSNGDPVTAADVVFSYRRLGYLNDSPAFLIGAHTVSHRVIIDRVEAVGRFAVRVTLPSPDVSFMAALTTPAFGVLDARVARSHGGRDSPDSEVKDRATTWLDAHSIGTGPFVLRSWVRGGTGRIVLVRNPYFWGPRPHLNRIVFQGTPDAVTQKLEVARGTVDIAANVDIDGARALATNPNATVVTGNTLDLIYLAMSARARISRPLSHVKVRQAIRLALDYRGIIAGLLGGNGTQPAGMIPVGLVGSDPATNNRLEVHTNVALARRLMRQAGYARGFSVTMQYPGGFIFDGDSFDTLAPKVAHDLAAIGIKVKLDATQLSVLLPAWREGRQSPLILFAWAADFPDSAEDASAFASGGFNARHVGYTWNAGMARVATRADSTRNVSRRAALYRSMLRTWLKEGPWAPIVQPKGIVVLHHGVTNYQYSPVFPDNLSFVIKR